MDVRLGVICVVIGSFLVSVFSSLCFYVFFLIRKGLLFLSQQNFDSYFFDWEGFTLMGCHGVGYIKGASGMQKPSGLFLQKDVIFRHN